MKMPARPTAALLLSLSLVSGANAAAQAPRRLQTAPPRRTDPAPDPLKKLLADGEQAIERNDFAGAASAFEKYLAQRPEDAFAHFQLGYAYTGLRRWEQAKAEYRKAAELDPKMSAAQLNLGLLLLDQDPAAAVEPLRKAAELLPKEARPRLLLAMALERSGKLESAIREYETAAQLEAKGFDIHLALARALLASNRTPEAEAEFRRTLALRADSAPARLGLAESLIGQKKSTEAATELAAYLEQQPQDRESRAQLASVLFDLGKYEPALAELDRAESGAQPSLAGLRLRAEIYVRLKRLDEANQALEKAAALAPQDADLHAQLGRLLLEKRAFAAAERELQQALRLQPNLADAVRDLGAVYYLSENYPAALQALDRLAQLETPTTGSWFIRATCYDKLGTKAEAIAAYEKFLALDAGRDDKQSFQARQRIRLLTRELNRKR